VTMTPQARRLALLGVALSLTLGSAGWLFFGAHEGAHEGADAAPVAAPIGARVPARARPAAAVAATAAGRDSTMNAETSTATATTAAPSAAAPEPVRSAKRRAARRDTMPSVVTIERETFAYAADGRRDPFRALIATAAIRPLPSELRLVAVVYDSRNVGSVAILRDLTTNAQHRVRPGQLLGRMRVAQIRPKHVVFTIEELGFSRQEVLGLQDSSATRMP
jgi:hypothetical protein